MYAFWTAWALIVGAIAAVSTDNCSKTVNRTFIRRLPIFIFIGLGVPIMASIAWPPINDGLSLSRLLFAGVPSTVAFGIGLFVALFLRWLVNNHKLMCAIGRHRECIVEEFPSDETTILGVKCVHCDRPRCTVNTFIARYPSKDYSRSVQEARQWLEGQLGSKVGGVFVDFR